MANQIREVEVTYNNHAALIWGSVWQTSRRFPTIPQEEVLSQAHEVFCHCYRKWEDEKGVKFSTYLTASLKAIFSDCGWYKKPTDKALDSDRVGVNGMCGPERLVLLKEALGQMTPLSVDIVNAVFYPPPLLRRTMREAQKSLINKRILRTYLRKDMRVSDANMITDAFNEISQTLEEV